MREIKFRAWNKQCRCESCGEFTSWERLLKIRYSGNFADNFFEDDDYVLEQYTGLKDKNGVEIYEGDVVSLPGFNIGYGVEVTWCNYLLSYDIGSRSVGNFREEELNNIEVIGNIHENPELLGDKNE